MIGAIIGDIAGSRFEFHNYKYKQGYQLLAPDCSYTDDSVMTLAVANALMQCQPDLSDLASRAVHSMQMVGRRYPHAGYGGRFRHWLTDRRPRPYNSYGNGAAMRVSPCAYISEEPAVCLEAAAMVTNVTHNHEESIRAVSAVTMAIWMARHNNTMQEIRDVITRDYYPLDFTLDSIRSSYTFDVSCQGSVPQALQAFFEAADFEDAIRNAISIGGDSDTIAAITGSIAEAYFGVPDQLRQDALAYLTADLRSLLNRFETKYPGKAAE